MGSGYTENRLGKSRRLHVVVVLAEALLRLLRAKNVLSLCIIIDERWHSCGWVEQNYICCAQQFHFSLLFGTLFIQRIFRYFWFVLVAAF